MFSSLRFRLWLTYVLVVGTVIFIAAAVLVIYLLRNPANDRRELQRLRVISTFISNRNSNFLETLEAAPSPRLVLALSRADRQLGVRTTLFSETGELLADSRQSLASPLPSWSTITSLSEPIFRDLSGRQWLFNLTQLDNGQYLLLAVPRIRTPLLVLMRDEILAPFARGVLIALFLSLIMAVWIANWISAPLKRIASAARQMSFAKFPKIQPEGPREVKDLALAFNEMGERVQASQRSQQDFIANVSHDLKTPLTSIQGFAQAIIDGTAEGPEAGRQAARVIYDEAGRLHEMILELLELARFDAGMAHLQRSSVDLVKLLNEVRNKFESLALHNNIRLQFDLSAGHSASVPSSEPLLQDVLPPGVLPSITGDAERLSQLFSNLVENAVKFTPAGGWVRLSAREYGDKVEVMVEDTGPGIPPDEIGRIFERFYQTDKSRRGGAQRGVGLGLAISREIVQAHGGEIQVVNKSLAGEMGMDSRVPPESGTGSIFIVRLPRSMAGETTLLRRSKDRTSMDPGNV